MNFGTEAGYWPWAAIVLAITAVLLFGLRKYYDAQENRG